MSFKEQYTTAELVSKEAEILIIQDPKSPLIDEKFTILEKDKIVLTNDAYAIGQLLETLVNKVRYL